MRRSVRLCLLLSLTATAGCTTLEDFFGLKKSAPTTLQLVGISIASDHPVNPLAPGGPAAAALGTAVRFTCTGTFEDVNKPSVLTTADVTSSVIWDSSDPLVAQPGADGAAFTNSSGTTVIQAFTPAVGNITAFASSAITLTVATSGP